MSLLPALAGHFWTLAPSVAHRVRPRRAPAAEPWTVALEDPGIGRVVLSGRLRALPGADTVLIVVHGLGGGAERPYCIRAALAAERAGASCLRIALRGADRRGEDFYHAGLVADLEAAIGSPALAVARRILLLGYSLGGHLVLRYAAGQRDPRVRATAAICAPIDLEASARHLDEQAGALYRRHVLAGLREIYEAVARRRPVPTPIARIRRVRSLREWDDLTVAPRFGFAGAGAYYARESAAQYLGQLDLPCLYVGSRFDPMVPPSTLEPGLGRAGARLEVRWIAAGGHVGFPRRVDLESEVVGWLMSH